MYWRSCRCEPCKEANTRYYADLAGRIPVADRKKMPCARCGIGARYRGRIVCRLCVNEESRIRMNEKHRRQTPEEYEAMLYKQGGVCAICFQVEKQGTKQKPGRVKELAEDHDHETNEVRGLLCAACNTGLGLFRDDPDCLEQAALYLRRRGK